jgi:hypothetical protein
LGSKTRTEIKEVEEIPFEEVKVSLYTQKKSKQ